MSRQMNGAEIYSHSLDICQLGMADCNNWANCQNKEYCRFVTKAWSLTFSSEAVTQIQTIVVAFSIVHKYNHQEMTKAGWAEAIALPWRIGFDIGTFVDRSYPDSGYEKAIDIPYRIDQEGLFVIRSIEGLFHRAEKFPYVSSPEGLFVIRDLEAGWAVAEYLPEYLEDIPF